MAGHAARQQCITRWVHKIIQRGLPELSGRLLPMPTSRPLVAAYLDDTIIFDSGQSTHSRQNDGFLFFRVPAQAFFKAITLKHVGWAPTDVNCSRLTTTVCSSSPAGVHRNTEEKVSALTNMSTPRGLEQLSPRFIWLLEFLQASGG